MNINEWKETTGAKRLRRTKDEIARGLTPEQALQERLTSTHQEQENVTKISSKSSNGKLIINIIPEKGTDKDYFELIPNQAIKLEMDEKFYLWLDEIATHNYKGNLTAALQDMLNNAISLKILSRGTEIKDHSEDSQAVKAES